MEKVHESRKHNSPVWRVFCPGVPYQQERTFRKSLRIVLSLTGITVVSLTWYMVYLPGNIARASTGGLVPGAFLAMVVWLVGIFSDLRSDKKRRAEEVTKNNRSRILHTLAPD